MDAMNRFKNNVIKGLILDEHGNWIDLKEKVRKEREFIKHVASGEVLFDGTWIPISEAKKLLKQKSITISSSLENCPLDRTGNPSSKKYARQENLDYPPETSLLTSNENSGNKYFENEPLDKELINIPESKSPSFIDPIPANSDEIILSEETIQQSFDFFHKQVENIDATFPPDNKSDKLSIIPVSHGNYSNSETNNEQNKTNVYQVSQLAQKKVSPRDTHFIVISEDNNTADQENIVTKPEPVLKSTDEEIIACQETIAFRVDQIPLPKENPAAFSKESKPATSAPKNYEEETNITSSIHHSNDKTGIYSIEDINKLKKQNITDQTDGIYSSWEKEKKKRRTLVVTLTSVAVIGSGIGILLAWLYL